MSDAPALPRFRYHPDPIDTGSVIIADATCVVCRQARGAIYAGPIYAGDDLSDAICPWCIADGSAYETLGATFVDSEAFPAETPDAAVTEITERTPGYAAWQSEAWPACCSDATAFLGPVGIAEIRERHSELEGFVLSHIIYELGISGGAATRMLQSLRRDASPTAYLFRCLHCGEPRVHVDYT